MALSPLLLKSLFGCVSVAGVGAAASFQIYQAYGDKPSAPGNIPEPADPNKPSEPGTTLKNEENSDTGKSSGPAAQPSGDGKSPALPTHVEDIPTLTTNSVVVVKAKADLTFTSQISVDSTNHDYKCKVSDDDDTTDFCSLVKLDLSNNWIDVNGIKKASATGTVSLADLNNELNYYKLELNDALYNKVVLTDNKLIEIISTTTANKKLAKLRVSFKVKDNAIDYVSTKHLLGRLETAPESIESSTKHQCFWTSPATTDATKACSIFSFGSTTTTLSGARYHKQTVTNLLTPVSTGVLTQHHNFVIEHETPLTKAGIATNKTLYVKKLDNDALSGDGKLENVVPVIIQGTNKKAFILSETPSYSIIVKKSAPLESSKSISHTNSTKNYKCKLSPSDIFDCDLVDLGLSDSKTSMNVAAIKNADLTSALSIAQPDTEIKYFKLDVPFTQFEAIKTTLSSTPSAIELVDSTDESAKIGDLNTVFAIDDDNVPHFQKSTFLVKKAIIAGEGMVGDGTINTAKTRYCSFSSTDSPSSTITKCELIDLGSSDISSSTSMTGVPATTPIATANTYLVNFIDANSNSISVAQDTKGDNNMLFLQEDGSDATKKLVAKFVNEHIQSALVVDGDSSKKFLFIIA